MANTGRYTFSPCVMGRIGRRKTLAEAFRAWRIRRSAIRPDVAMVTGYFPPIYPRR